MAYLIGGSPIINTPNVNRGVYFPEIDQSNITVSHRFVDEAMYNQPDSPYPPFPSDTSVYTSAKGAAVFMIKDMDLAPSSHQLTNEIARSKQTGQRARVKLNGAITGLGTRWNNKNLQLADLQEKTIYLGVCSSGMEDDASTTVDKLLTSFAGGAVTTVNGSNYPIGAGEPVYHMNPKPDDNSGLLDHSKGKHIIHGPRSMFTKSLGWSALTKDTETKERRAKVDKVMNPNTTGASLTENDFPAVLHAHRATSQAMDALLYTAAAMILTVDPGEDVNKLVDHLFGANREKIALALADRQGMLKNFDKITRAIRAAGGISTDAKDRLDDSLQPFQNNPPLTVLQGRVTGVETLVESRRVGIALAPAAPGNQLHFRLHRA